MTRKFFYSIDVLLCCIFLVFSYHNMFYFHFPWLNVTVPGVIFAIYPIWLRMNTSFLLYRKERLSIIPIVLFTGIFVYLFYYTFSNHLGWRYCMNWLHRAYDETFCAPEKTTSYVLTEWGVFRWENPLVVILNLWTLLVPPIAYVVLFAKKRLTTNTAKWHHLLGTYIFSDNAGRKFLPMLAIFFAAYLLGSNNNVELSGWGVAILPTLAYALVAKYVGYKARLWEYVLLVASLYAFTDSQFFFDTPRIVMMIASAVGILIVCVHLAFSTRKNLTSIVTYLIVGFILPILTLGYNLYVGTDCARMHNYNDYYISRGVMYVRNGNNMGIRSRYNVVLPPKYAKIEPVVVPDVYRWNVSENGDSIRVLRFPAKLSKVLAVTENGDSVIYIPHGNYFEDVKTHEWRSPSAEDVKR